MDKKKVFKYGSLDFISTPDSPETDNNGQKSCILNSSTEDSAIRTQDERTLHIPACVLSQTASGAFYTAAAAATTVVVVVVVVVVIIIIIIIIIIKIIRIIIS